MQALKKFVKWVLMFFGALVVLGIVIASCSSDKTSNSSSSNQPSAQETQTATDQSNTESQPAEPEQLETVTADQILNAYKTNEIAANQALKDKKFIVTGVIHAISADFSDKPVIELKAGGEYEFNQPQASLAEGEENKAASLGKGQSISMVCIGNSEVAGTPMLKDCVIQNS
ncbi:hypothetical protein E0H82_03785 [Acinetobacter sp. ANC 4910]|uniref:OB-fold protein n=1 Tax=Acinetobacter sp. ANC 4910 TaxID=2529850 RepID=UPI00103E47B8|nr:hypothetical protein [Acinetobacter sp. ANC 4910]TCB36841.1 hypothetical protein E0H82_03785 [Acinetobacter sp. ANC 4910]